MNDIFVKKYLLSLNVINKKRIDNNIYNYIINRYEDAVSFEESVYRIKNNINEKPICPICGKKINGNRKGFNKTCSRKCGSELSYLTRKNQLLEKYNIENVFQLSSTKEKIKQTNLDRYGVEYPFQSETIRNNYKETCLKKYGVDNSTKNKDIQQKIKETTYKNYGVYCGCNLISHDDRLQALEKSYKTCLKKYGVDNPWKNPATIKKIQEKRKEHMPEIVYKIRQTCIERYGVDWYTKTEEYKKHINWEEKKQKEYITKKKNGTFKLSNTEDISYTLIKDIYSDVKRQYKSNKYPFNCDFYIPSIDTYIECNYFWTHGDKPFEGIENDINKINYWKSKNTDYYDNAVETWTIRDVNKRTIAKENNLKYLEFFKIQDLKDWITLQNT